MAKHRPTAGGEPPRLLARLRQAAGQLGDVAARMTAALEALADIPPDDGAEVLIALNAAVEKQERFANRLEALAAQPDLFGRGPDKKDD
jgi:hypothetical protein